jgi:hypothetical protein
MQKSSPLCLPLFRPLCETRLPLRRAPILAALLLAVAGLALHADPPAPGSYAAAFSDDGLVKLDDLSKVKDTQLVAHPDVPLNPAHNVIWCGTLQLAWNEAIKLVGEKLQFTQQPPVADLLNRQDFTRADLSPDCYVAVADFERNQVEAEIRAALDKVFHGAASPELIPDPEPNPGPYDFVAYSYLFKNLQFPQVFEENDPLNFGPNGTAVKSFGFIANKDKLAPGVFRQVKIYDYQGPNDFIIKLKTKDPQDELILAEIAPGATLQATIDTVLKRMTTGSAVTAAQRDKLSIPKLNFDLRTDFPELEGLTLKPGPNTPVKNLVTSEVKQLVRFQLNEKGAVLKSEATMVMTASALGIPLDIHEMIFSQPFLILMKQADSAQPYFAMWVGNTSLLTPAK